MRQQCEFEATQVPVRVWCDAPPAPPTPPGPRSREQDIDLDRVVWDPEYRREVLETLRVAG